MLAGCRCGIAVLPHFLAEQFPNVKPVLKEVIQLKRPRWLVEKESPRDIARVRIVMDHIVDL